eukprot:gene16082-21843_t
MDIVQFKREQEQHKLHRLRVRNIQPVISTSTPESLGLKHLKTRPKKQQLIEDRRQMVAKENAKLMERMTKIMAENRLQPKHERPPSLNEVGRKREVDRNNFENRLMIHRLKTVPPVLDRSVFEKDFQHHLKASQNLRKRQMKPLQLPNGSPENDMRHKLEDTPLFDTGKYSLQKNSLLEMNDNNYDNINDMNGPIRSMSDFRREVIAPKKVLPNTSGRLQSPKSAPNITNNNSDFF